MSPDLTLIWYVDDPDLKNWVDSKIKEIKPYLSSIIKHFYEMQWGKGTEHENYPSTIVQVEFNEGFHKNGMMLARVFWLEFGSDSNESFFVELEEYKGINHRLAGSDKVNFSDWIN